MKAEDIQVAGEHYKKMDYQTGRFGYDVGLESFGTQIAKYLTRDKGSRVENLEKAYHCISLEQQYELDSAREQVMDGIYEPTSYLDIYEAYCDDKFIDRYFAQFEDGKKLKGIMINYMKANFSAAKRGLRRYINTLAELKRGDLIVMKCGGLFSTGGRVAEVLNIINYKGKDLVIIVGGESVASELVTKHLGSV